MLDQDKIDTFQHPVTKLPQDEVTVGSWYWVTCSDFDGKEYVLLMCVTHIGSNYVAFKCHSEKWRGEITKKVHFDDFFKLCRPEQKWKEYFQNRLDEIQTGIREKTIQLSDRGRELCLLKSSVDIGATQEGESFLPVKATVDPVKHKEDLLRFQKDLPQIVEEIKKLGEAFSNLCQNLSLPDITELENLKHAMEKVGDRIFTVELYCGLQEQVKQIACGEPAEAGEPIAVRQQLLYMDEESLFDYNHGGMDFESLDKWDEWIVRPENLDRLLPEQRGIVAFKVRRKFKEYGKLTSISQLWIRMWKDDENMKTYLLIRNGQNVFRIASSVDFEPRLIPLKGEVGEAQFIEKSSPGWGDEEKNKPPRIITKNDIEFDDHVEKLNKAIKHYNRIVILLQGLLDRSKVFDPHPRINLCKPECMHTSLKLIRDEEEALPGPTLDWKVYQKQLNQTLRKGKWIAIDKYAFCIHKKENDENTKRESWYADPMPRLCQVQQVKSDGSMVRVSWPQGHNSRWHWNKDGKWTNESDRMCHEWIPVEFVLNVEAYTPNDYKIFLFHHKMKKDYLEWAPLLLTAEDWVRNRLKGISPEKDNAAKSEN